MNISVSNSAEPNSRWAPLDQIQIAGHSVVTASRSELVQAWASDCKATKASSTPSTSRVVFDVNGQGVSMFETDQAYREAVSEADIVHADGGFLVLLSGLVADKKIAERSPTTDMFHDFAAEAEQLGLSFYLLGGSEAVNMECFEIMKARYPMLRIVGRRNGFFSQQEEVEIVKEIAQLKPDLLWVGLGKPKEQLFSVKWRDALLATWIVTCGGCYNYVTGEYKRAPQWMRRSNLEWLHRLASDPKRLFWRYAKTSPHALWVTFKYSKIGENIRTFVFRSIEKNPSS